MPLLAGIGLCSKFIEKHPLVFNSGLTKCQWAFVHLMSIEWGWLEPEQSYLNGCNMYFVNSDYRVNPVEISSQNCNLAWYRLEAQKMLVTHSYCFIPYSATMNSICTSFALEFPHLKTKASISFKNFGH